MTTISAEAVLRLREALYGQLGEVAEELTPIILSREREHADWSEPVARFDRTRALLDEIGWNERDPERDVAIDLDQHREVIIDALREALATEQHFMAEQGDHAAVQRQRAYARALTIETWAASVGLEVGVMPEQDRELIALGRTIRRLRTERHITERELAATTGVTPERLAAIEAGRFDPRYDALLALAYALNVKPSELVNCADAEAKAGDA